MNERLRQREALDAIADPASQLVVASTRGGRLELGLYRVRVLAGITWREGAQGHEVAALVVRSLISKPVAVYALDE